MIQCVINGSVAFPDTSAKVKITYENQYIKDSGSYTYEIQFPMAIAANRIFFRFAGRLDVGKRLPEYEDCKLYVDNRLLISGKGVVASITDTIVKLQIIGGASRIKYNSKFALHFIDEVDFPDFSVKTEAVKCRLLGKNWMLGGFYDIDLSTSNMVGQEGVYTLCPIYDETNDTFSNGILVGIWADMGRDYPDAKMYNLAIQPNLFFVLRRLLEFEGYTLTRNDFDKEPWNRLYIANVRRTMKMNLALPHWTVYTFIDELRKLFNATFIFNDAKKTCQLVATGELDTADIAEYDCIDEFTSERNEDGIKYIATSNVEFSMADSAARSYLEILPHKALKEFAVVDCQNREECITKGKAMAEKQRRTTIFRYPQGYIVFVVDYETEDSENMIEMAKEVGMFSPIIRNENSEESVKLKIVPVAMTTMKRWKSDDNEYLLDMDWQGDITVLVPSAQSSKEESMDSLVKKNRWYYFAGISEGDTSGSDDEDIYLTVQDALEDASVLDTKVEDDDSRIELFFQSPYTYNYKNKQPELVMGAQSASGATNVAYRYPLAFTDYRMFPQYTTEFETATLTLQNLPHLESLGKYASKILVDQYHQVTIKFISNDIPDPSCIFSFRGKRYICEKIEMEASNTGVDRLKTGYFYEII
ncbi:MAG: hypothetical protein ACI37N_03355 [Prevotella sp.]